MKVAIIISVTILAIWAILGFVYFVVDILRDLNCEALINPDEDQCQWKIIAFGPAYWSLFGVMVVCAAIIQLIGILLKYSPQL